ncbi:PREDICTED: R-spondin-3-like [Priapulus caudatus]|uniref:R-spondin-3-like n=1 Tax=Priapulus caudatus TaxID=37621 RepID=A0ABM1ELK4_PRICU|nr:PREDICTED: R-spondin-3-like [Priapulus caudatus]
MDESVYMFLVDCLTTSWSSWTFCNWGGKPCKRIEGFQQRYRTIVQYPSRDGRQCPPVTELRMCYTPKQLCIAILTNKSEIGSERKQTNNPKRKKKKKKRKRRPKKDHSRHRHGREWAVKRDRKRRQRKARRMLQQQRHGAALAHLPANLPDLVTNEIK